MQKHGKKYRAAAAQVNQNQAYAPKEALALAKATSTTSFRVDRAHPRFA
jgi:large subunit ribosomal protein L1